MPGVCIAKDPPSRGAGSAAPGNAARLAAHRPNKWRAGDTITIKFLNGTANLHSKVRQYARVWLLYANLYMNFVNANQYADVRVAFNRDGHWSLIGTSCRDVQNQNEPTMNLDHNSIRSEVDYASVILHEFGHALGCIHEHQSPAAGIHWNKEFVYKFYLDTQDWDRKEVDAQVFKKAETNLTQFSAFDRYSIMLYPIPPGHASNIVAGWNNTLSATDKAYIAQIYPGGNVVPVNPVGPVDGGTAIETRDSKGQTPLHIACRDGNEERVRTLLRENAQIEAKEYIFGYTPLHMAVWHRHDRVVLLLLLYGASKTAKTRAGHTPLSLARMWNDQAIIGLLTGSA